MPTVPTSPPTAPRAAAPFHEPRRANCPWCGSGSLRTRIRAADPLRHRPGTLTLDGCVDCGHVFQNPRLTAEALAFFHAEFYEEQLAAFCAHVQSARAVRRRHRAAARRLSGLPEPESWLDVGTGHGHFPEAAKEFFPYTSFDGLDPTARVERARAQERVEEAHRGFLSTPGTAERLRGRYDVVSLFRHLQHTPDPRAELRAALTVLRPGGHLVVEAPDPRCLFALLLGRRWLPYGQPRHLHLVPLSNLRAELERLGCTVLVTDRKDPHIPYDLSAALTLTLPPALRPAASPLVAALSLLDHLLTPLTRHAPFSNAYRLVCRKNQATGGRNPLPS